MKANTVKKQILDEYDAFTAIPKVADVKATIRGKEYRVKITKGSVTKIVSDRKAVWTPESDVDALRFIDDLVHPVAEKKMDVSEAEKKNTKVVVDDNWIDYLEGEANKSALLRDGDTIRFRVATSHGKPVCAHIDLYQGDKKITTAGIHYRIGFAARGINNKWTTRVDEAIREIYRKMDLVQVKHRGGAIVKLEEGIIKSATGPISDILDILENIN